MVTGSKPNNVDDQNNVKCETSRHFRNNKKEHLKAKIHDLETNSKTKNFRDLYNGISYSTKGYGLGLT
jgi:hypothetical protein